MTALRETLTPIYTALGMASAAVLLAALILCKLAQLVFVKGGSMEHTLRAGDLLLVTKWGKYGRGDVVICHYPRRSEELLRLGAAFSLTKHTVFVKRLAALPGDTVEIAEGRLIVNGQVMEDPEKMASPPRDYPCRRLAKNQYFVIGDHRASSHDSRASDVGPIPESMLIGHVRFRLWPLKRIGRIK
ncbi:MAG: signal peptidase I [Clostridia bacterium]|nr:signal peptidase I [Clostridia bacterium]